MDPRPRTDSVLFDRRRLRKALAVVAGGTAIAFAGMALGHRWGWTSDNPAFALWWGAGVAGYLSALNKWLNWGLSRRTRGNGAWLLRLHIGTTFLSDYQGFHLLVMPLVLAVVEAVHPSQGQPPFLTPIVVPLFLAELGFFVKGKGYAGSGIARLIVALMGVALVILPGKGFHSLFAPPHVLPPGAWVDAALMCLGGLFCLLAAENYALDALRLEPWAKSIAERGSWLGAEREPEA